MMSGEEPDNWNLQIKIVDENTGKIIKEGDNSRRRNKNITR